MGLQRGKTLTVHPRWPRCLGIVALLAGLWLSTAQAGLVHHGISAGLLKVDQIPGWSGGDDNTNCIVTLTFSINDFRIGSFNRGDYNVQIGSSSADDIYGGILISSVTQNGRNNYGTNQFPVTMIHDGGGTLTSTPPYRICTHGVNVPGTGGSSIEYNVNVAGAWFPYDRYLGGLARNSLRVNNGSNDLLIASSQIQYGTHFLHIAVTNELAAGGGWLTNAGRSVLDLRSLGINSQTDGILLVNHGKDEANFALSRPNPDGTWTLYVHDNATSSASSYEQDPIAFVFIPRTNTHVISGRFLSDAGGQPTIDMYSGDSPQFTVTFQGAGRWYLQMNNYWATNGVLIISPEGGGTYNLDNIVSYQMTEDGRGWQIQSRDTPNNGLQTPYAIINGETFPEGVCSFVFIPAPTPGFTVTPTASLLTTESGGTAQFTVVLHAPPTANVVINLASSNPAEGTVLPATLTFTPANWSTPQTVTVTGVDDADVDGQIPYTIILSPATSADAGYNGLDPEDVAVVNADNEAGITVSRVQLTTTEAGGTATFTVVLNTQPTDTVTLGLSSSNPAEGTVVPASLTFTPENWNTPQTVTVTGVDDFVADGNATYTIITAPAASADPAYNGFNALDVSVVNLDNDTAGLVLSATGGLTVSEPGTTTNFTVRLTSQPTANVTVSVVSGDSTEGVVSPASRTFTPANWATPQSFTLTGVDDFINDGTIAYTLNLSITSGDPIYAAMTRPISARTLDNEAELTLPSGPLQYGIGLPGVAIDGQATIVDPDTANYNGGSLTVTLTANGTASDRLEIRHTGNGAGEIGVSGNTVSFGGVPIGSFSGGVGTAPLVVAFNAAANPVSAQALLRAVTFRNVLSAPSIAPRTATFALADGVGGTSTASQQIELGLLCTSEFQNGKDGGFGVYTNAADCELNSAVPDANYPQGSSPLGIRIHTPTAGNPFPEVEALLRFDNIIGTAPGQIPPGALIVSADLYLNITDSGDGSPLYRMLVPWDADYETWNSMGNGVDMDDVEARSEFFSQINVTNLSQATGVGLIKVSVVPDVQAWANGEPNYGWVMPCWYMNNSASRDLTIFTPCESTNLAQRPRLVVKWVPAGTAWTSFRQGVNGYTGAKDTRIRQITPDTEYSTVTGLFVDYEVTSGLEDPEQVFLRFDDIIGTGPGQVPPGATIHAAVLDLGSTIGNATGDGGRIHRMLRSWSDTDTWNSLVNGIEADGVEAATVPTATAGNINLTETVQGGYHTFYVTADVQLWANGAPNPGWALLPWPYGGDGWGFASSEHEAVRDRPQLRVYYTSNYVANIRLGTPTRLPTSVLVPFVGTPNTLHYVLRAPDVTGPWTTNGTATTGLDGKATYTDNAPLAGRAFYRVVQP